MIVHVHEYEYCIHQIISRHIRVIHTHMYVYIYICMCIYIYRERERELGRACYMNLCLLYVVIYIIYNIILSIYL